MQRFDRKEGTMTRIRTFVSAAGIAVMTSMTGVAVAQQPSSPPPGAGGSPSSTVGEVLSMTGTVKKVDTKKREVWLTDNAGVEHMINVPEDVTRLDAVKKGDTLNLTYKQAIALSLKKGGEVNAPSEVQVAERKPGELPGGGMARQITASAKVTKIDPEKNTLTFKGPEGNSDTINVSDPQMQADMKKIKVGDRIQATYTEAIAMSVTPKSKE
jgi:Cu/Ag efflux protein CusF